MGDSTNRAQQCDYYVLFSLYSPSCGVIVRAGGVCRVYAYCVRRTPNACIVSTFCAVPQGGAIDVWWLFCLELDGSFLALGLSGLVFDHAQVAPRFFLIPTAHIIA